MVRIYYLLTPLFVLLDFGFGWNIRIAGLSGVDARLWYYGFCLLCAVMVWLRPGLQPLVGLAESSVNFAILIIAFATATFLPVAGDSSLLRTGSLINFLVTGTILIFCFQSSIRRLQGRRSPLS